MARDARPGLHARPLLRIPVLSMLLALGLALGGCQQTDVEESTRKPSDGLRLEEQAEAPLEASTPAIQAALDQLIDEGGRAQGADQLRYANQIARYGPHGLPALTRGLKHEQPGSRILSAYMLGLSDDPRVIPNLQAALSDPYVGVRQEAATALLRHGDRRGLPTLLSSLRDADPRVRARGIQVLEERVGTNMGFRPTDPPAERAAALARWDDYARRLGAGPAGGGTGTGFGGATR